MKSRKFSYFGSKFSGCSKSKEKSHDVIMALLGSKEQGSCTWLGERERLVLKDIGYITFDLHIFEQNKAKQYPCI